MGSSFYAALRDAEAKVEAKREDRAKSEWWEALGKLTASIALGLLTATGLGFVLQLYWLWFLTPTIGVRPLTLLEAYGVWLMTRLILAPRINFSKKETESVWKRWRDTLITVIVFLVFGFVVHWLLTL